MLPFKTHCCNLLDGFHGFADKMTPHGRFGTTFHLDSPSTPVIPLSCAYIRRPAMKAGRDGSNHSKFIYGRQDSH